MMQQDFGPQITVYRYDDGMKHLVLNFPQHGTWITLCGTADCCSNERRGKPLKSQPDCPDCEYALRQTQHYLRNLTPPAEGETP